MNGSEKKGRNETFCRHVLVLEQVRRGGSQCPREGVDGSIQVSSVTGGEFLTWVG